LTKGVRMSDKNLLDFLADKVTDYASEFMVHPHPAISFARRSVANIIAFCYAGGVLYYYQDLPSAGRHYMMALVAVLVLLLGIIFVRQRAWRGRDERMPFREQKPYQLFVIHWIIGISMVLINEFPRFGSFVLR